MRAFLKGCPIMFRSGTKKYVCQSVTEAKLRKGATYAQDMLYVMKVVQSLELNVKLSMLLETDNKMAKNFANNKIVGGRIRHIDLKQYFLWDLKEEVLLEIKHDPGDENDADLYEESFRVYV